MAYQSTIRLAETPGTFTLSGLPGMTFRVRLQPWAEAKTNAELVDSRMAVLEVLTADHDWQDYLTIREDEAYILDAVRPTSARNAEPAPTALGQGNADPTRNDAMTTENTNASTAVAETTQTTAPVAQTETERLMAELARLTAENNKLKAKTTQQGKLSLRVSEKGAVSVYGLGRFPVTLYREQWTKLFAISEDVKTFIQANETQLKVKEAKSGAKDDMGV